MGISLTVTSVAQIEFDATSVEQDGFALRRLTITDVFGDTVRITLSNRNAAALIPQIDRTETFVGKPAPMAAAPAAPAMTDEQVLEQVGGRA